MDDEHAYFINMPEYTAGISPKRAVWLRIRSMMGLGRFGGPPAVRTVQGQFHEVNQDAVFASPGRLVVADGISSGFCSQIASHLVASHLSIAGKLTDAAMVKTTLYINQLIRWVYEELEQMPGGTTMILAEIRGNGSTAIVNIGDSRGWLLSPGFFGGYSCIQITVDQTWGERKKKEHFDDADSLPDHVMFHAIGHKLEEKQVYVTSVTVPPGGCLLLTTDGAFKKHGDETVMRFAEIAEVSGSMDELADAIVKSALELGETDDISVAIYGRPFHPFGVRIGFWFALLCAAAIHI